MDGSNTCRVRPQSRIAGSGHARLLVSTPSHDGDGQARRAQGMAAIRQLDADECISLLSQHEMGRVAFVSDDVPVILPVNYVLDGNSIVSEPIQVRSWRRSPCAAWHSRSTVGGDSDAWSVLAQGFAREITDALGTRYDVLRSLAIPVQVPGDKEYWIAIDIRELSGRRIQQRTPARRLRRDGEVRSRRETRAGRSIAAPAAPATGRAEAAGARSSRPWSVWRSYPGGGGRNRSARGDRLIVPLRHRGAPGQIPHRPIDHRVRTFGPTCWPSGASFWK